MNQPPRIRLSNSIPEVLKHYQSETIDTLARIGQTASVLSNTPSIEGMSGASSRAKSLLRSLAWPGRARSYSEGPVLHLWPSFGIFEVALWHRPVDYLVYHDPIPLRRQIGFDPLSRFVAQHQIGGKPTIVSHSSDATGELRRIFPRHEIVNLLHPVLGNTRNVRTRGNRVVVVGQYKFARDVELLERLGPLLSGIGLQPMIFGRGWPQISGWTVTSGFLSEQDLDEVIGSALVVVLPYRKYFQSGVAVRALEQGTPVVSPRTSFITDLLGVDSSAIITEPTAVEEWVSAIRFAASQNEAQMELTRTRYVRNVDASWNRVFGTFS